eukprot:SAG31_NODE_2586_length_5430_cov_2.815044_6_plen_90_part_00
MRGCPEVSMALRLYTVAGGLFSVAYTDVVQAAIGWTGLTVGTYWIAGVLDLRIADRCMPVVTESLALAAQAICQGIPVFLQHIRSVIQQ